MNYYSKEMNEIMGELTLLRAVNKINEDKIEELTNNKKAEDYANKKENVKNITIEKWDENLSLKSLKFQFNSIYGYVVKYTTSDLKYSISAKINNRSEMIFEMTANDIWQEVEDEYFSIIDVGI